MPEFVGRGGRLHYETAGSSGDWVLLLHGYGGSSGDWEPQLASLAGQYRVLAPEHAGHGRSHAPRGRERYAMEAITEGVVAVLDHLGIGGCHVVGQSMGGAVAQELALAQPGRCLSLVLMDTTWWFGDHRDGAGPRWMDSQVAARMSAQAASMDADARRWTWEQLLAWVGTGDRASQIRMPTLIVHGEHDADAIVEGSQRLLALIAGAQLEVLAAAGHYPQLENPSAFNSVLLRFLSDTGNEAADRG